MIKRSFVVASLVCVAAAGLVRARAAQDVTLRYHWTKGETFRYRATQDVNVLMTNLPGGMGEMNITTTLVQMQQFQVDDVQADGTATVRAKYDSVKIDMGTPMGTMSYDSASPTPPSDPMSQTIAKSLGALVGETVTMVIAPSGTIKKVDGLAALAQKIAAGMPPNANAGMPGMNSFMTEDSLRGMFDQTFSALPEHAVKTGDSWKKDSTTKTVVGSVTAALTMVLKGVQQDLATIGVAGTTKVTVDPSATSAMPMQMTMTMGQGAIEGDVVLNTRTGRMQRSKVLTTQPMSMAMTGPDGSAMNLDATTKTTLTVELIEK